MRKIFSGRFFWHFFKKVQVFWNRVDQISRFFVPWGFRGWRIRIRKNFGEISDIRGYPDIADTGYNSAQKSYFEMIFGFLLDLVAMHIISEKFRKISDPYGDIRIFRIFFNIDRK